MAGSASSNSSGSASGVPTEVRCPVTNTILATGLQPAILNGYFRDHLIRHFGAAVPELPASPPPVPLPPFARDDAPDLRKLIWRPEDPDTGRPGDILIEDANRWKPQTTGQRPAVIIKRNAYKRMRVGIGDLMHGSIIDRQGHPHYSTFWIGSHTLFCIGRDGREADILAADVKGELTQIGPVVQAWLRLHRFLVEEIGGIGEIEETEEHDVVPVTVAIAYEESWILREEQPILRNVSIKSLLGLC